MFIEFPSAVTVAESNKVTHSIICAIYGNTTLVSKRTKNKRRNDCLNQGLKHECDVSSTYNTANLVTNCLSPVLRRVSVCIRMCVYVYVYAWMCLHTWYVYKYVHTGLCVLVCIWVHFRCICVCMCTGACTHACLYWGILHEVFLFYVSFKSNPHGTGERLSSWEHFPLFQRNWV